MWMAGEKRASGGANAAIERLAASFGAEAVAPEAKARRVRAVFDSVAKRYDLMNDLMSGGVHRLWKEAMLDWLAPRPGYRYLDVAGGTGDIAERLLNRTKGAASVTLTDINEAMLGVGRDRALDAGWVGPIAYAVADAMRLPFPSGSFDACTIAFGLRNVTRIDVALREMRRVLKPGGRFVCLEFSRVVLPVLDQVYDAYSFAVLPRLGAVVANDKDSYAYLAESIRRFPDQETLKTAMEDAGFERCSYRNLTGGVAAIHSGWRL